MAEGRGRALDGGATGRSSGGFWSPIVKFCPSDAVNWKTARTACWLPSGSGRAPTWRYWAARALSSTQPDEGIVMVKLVAPVGLGLADGDADGEGEADAEADPEGLAGPDVEGSGDAEALTPGSGPALGERGDTHGEALAVPDSAVTCTGSARPSRVTCAAVTPTRLTGSWPSLKTQNDSGALAPFGYPFGPA